MSRSATRLVLSLVLACALISGNTQAEDIYTYTNSQGDVVFTDHPTKGAKKITVNPPPAIPLTPINLPPPTPPTPPVAAPAPVIPPAGAGGSLVPSMSMTPPSAPTAPSVAAPIATPGSPSLPAGDQIQPSAPQAKPAYTPLSTLNTPPVSQPSDHYQTLQITEPKAGLVTAHAGGTIFVQTVLTPALDISAGDRIRILIDGTTRVDDSTGNRFMISDLTAGTHAIIAAVMRHGKNIFQSNPVVIQLQDAPATAAPPTNAPN